MVQTFCAHLPLENKDGFENHVNQMIQMDDTVSNRQDCFRTVLSIVARPRAVPECVAALPAFQEQQKSYQSVLSDLDREQKQIQADMVNCTF